MLNINITSDGVMVESALPQGVVILRGNSGSGKTFFMNALAAYCETNVIPYYMCNSQAGRFVDEAIIKSSEGCKMVLLDNADLYLTNDLLKCLRDKVEYIIISKKQLFNIDTDNVYYALVHYENNYLTLEVF